jgi:membrane-associated protein
MGEGWGEGPRPGIAASSRQIQVAADQPTSVQSADFHGWTPISMTRSPALGPRAVLLGVLLLIPIVVAVVVLLPFLKQLDLKTLIRTVGYPGLFAIVFAESGLYFGFFLPGDSLLFTAGLVASLSPDIFSLPVMIVLLSIAAIAGDSVGYWSGQKFGRQFFQREDSFWFHRRHLERAHDFYERHGGKAIVLARFLPIVRTFVPIVAGMALMSYPKFLAYNVVGGIGWVVSMSLGGYFFGSVLPAEDVDKLLLPVLALIVFISVAPTAWHLYKENRTQLHDLVRARLGR